MAPLNLSSVPGFPASTFPHIGLPFSRPQNARVLRNKQIIQRLYAFEGELLATVRSCGKAHLARVNRIALIALMKEDGAETPARCQFKVCGGKGYILPLRQA